MMETCNFAYRMTETREVSEVLVLVSGKVVNKVRDDLPFVIVPIEGCNNSGIGETLLKKAAKVSLVPIDGAECFFQSHNCCWRESLGHSVIS